MCYLLSSVSGRANARGHVSFLKGAVGTGHSGRRPGVAGLEDLSPADLGTI